MEIEKGNCVLNSEGDARMEGEHDGDIEQGNRQMYYIFWRKISEFAEVLNAG